MKKIILALAIGLIGSTQAMADSRTDQINRIIKQLDPVASAAQEGPAQAAGRIEIIVRRPSEYFVTHYGTSAEFPVFFNFGSAQLTEKGMIMLDALASAMRDPAISRYRYLVAGHTDAKGSWMNNQDLSERRAESVAAYLVEVGGVDPSRLITIGWGEERLKDPSRPNAGINRRVEVSFVTNEIVNVAPGTSVTVWQGEDRFTKSTISVQQIHNRFPGLEVKIDGGNQPVTIQMQKQPNIPARNGPTTVETDGQSVTVVVPSAEAAPLTPEEECARRLSNDPRPSQHNLDDFNTGRTPLKCEEDLRQLAPPPSPGGVNREGDRITIN
ncbi:OmpA family protein [uncultured Cohaesibacter sp.]|uniref:OmpA family protein n=1 Tax=uncultured Cohaesibacter sp. TaxID=1002546 RepID=UPI0029C98357|nr:OmpA family protein [uncultured Cohaesibacter sp.]